MKQTTSWVPDGSAASLSRWTDAAGTVATQAMGLFTTTARAASVEGEVGETSQSCADVPVDAADLCMQTSPQECCVVSKCMDM